MRYHLLRRVFGRTGPQRRRTRYPELTAECREELALIADRRRSDLIGS